MVKIPTNWTHNPNKNVGVPTYSSPLVSYSSPNYRYVSPTATLNDQNKPATSWQNAIKIAEKWSFNPKFAPVAYAYDGGATYDTFANNYDGIATNQSPISTKPLTAWTEV